jgi:hypothetical protein
MRYQEVTWRGRMTTYIWAAFKEIYQIYRAVIGEYMASTLLGLSDICGTSFVNAPSSIRR